MKSVQDGVGDDHAMAFDWSVVGSILVETEVSSRGVIVSNVCTQNAPKMCGAPHDHMVETFPSRSRTCWPHPQSDHPEADIRRLARALSPLCGRRLNHAKSKSRSPSKPVFGQVPLCRPRAFPSTCLLEATARPGMSFVGASIFHSWEEQNCPSQFEAQLAASATTGEFSLTAPYRAFRRFDFLNGEALFDVVYRPSPRSASHTTALAVLKKCAVATATSPHGVMRRGPPFTPRLSTIHIRLAGLFRTHA